MSEKYASKSEKAAEEKQLVVKLALEKRMRIEHCGENHMKVRGVNFHPSTGTYYRDGQPREPGKGAKDFIEFVESRTAAERGTFAILAPTLNFEMSSTIDSYVDHLDLTAADALPLVRVSLEGVVAAIYDAGATDLGRQLDERYLDFSPVYDLIDDWEPHTMV